jgi:hypothetical protein
MFRKLVHPDPGDRLILLHILENLQGFWSLTEPLARMANPAKFDVRNSGRTKIFNIAVAKHTTQIQFYLMDLMIEEDGLVHRLPGEDREDGKEDPFRLILIPVISHNGNDKDEEYADQNKDSFFHKAAGSSVV